MKRNLLLLTNRFGVVWFSIGILSAIGVVSSLDIYITRRDALFILWTFAFGLVGGFSFWLLFSRFYSWKKNSPNLHDVSIVLDIGNDGFKYSDQILAFSANWAEITFMGIYQVLHLGYSKKYFVVVANSIDILTIDCDVPSFSSLSEQLYLHFPHLKWNWYYEFRLDKSFPRSRVIFGSGDSIKAWQQALKNIP